MSGAWCLVDGNRMGALPQSFLSGRQVAMTLVSVLVRLNP